MAQVGKRNLLSITREMPQGVYLDGGKLGEILLPRKFAPARWQPGDQLDVFVYYDSEDRLIATTERPLAEIGEFACLRVVGVNRAAGAFLDWGLSKDLLLPFREQESPVRLGDQVVVAVDLDPRSNRIIASSRLRRYLSPDFPTYRIAQEVGLLITRETPLGYEAIIERSHLGLLYKNSSSPRLSPGQKIKGYIREVRPDGKIDLSLDALGYRRIGSLQQQILQAMKASGGHLNLNDDSSPEEIRETFGISKKAFKQSLGALYKKRLITFTETGVELARDAIPKR
jgi:predicted RNA-binding protein (virulence factor B family)